MEGSIKVPEQSADEKPQQTATGELTSKEIAGKIATHIGTGRNAKDSFIWMTITWSFRIATGLSVLIFARSFFEVGAKEDLIESLAKIWGAFMPIITLALGYAFGKGE